MYLLLVWKKKIQRLPFITSQGKKQDLYVLFCKENPPYCAHRSSQKLSFLPCSRLYLEGGLVCFGICETFQPKGWLVPSPQHFNVGFPSSRLPVIYVDLWDLWPHGWTGYWSAVLAHVICPVATALSRLGCLSCRQRNPINRLWFFCCFYFTRKTAAHGRNYCSHVCLGCGGKSSQLLPVSDHWSKQRGRVSGLIRLPQWPRHKQLPEPLLGDQHTDLEKSSTSFFFFLLRITIASLPKKEKKITMVKGKDWISAIKQSAV